MTSLKRLGDFVEVLVHPDDRPWFSSGASSIQMAHPPVGHHLLKQVRLRSKAGDYLTAVLDAHCINLDAASDVDVECSGVGHFQFMSIVDIRTHIRRLSAGPPDLPDAARIAKNAPACASSENMRRLIDNASTPIFGIDSDGRVNEWNLKAAEIVGYSSDEVMGRNLVEEFISPDHRVRVKEVLDNALQGRDTANFEFPLFAKSQARVDVLLNVTTRRDANGDITGVVVVGKDITDLNKADLEQNRLAENLRLLSDTTIAPIIGIDRQGRVSEWNHKAAEIMGYKRDEVMGCKLVEELISPDHRVQAQGALNDALQGHEMARFEFPLVSKSDERVDVLLNAAAYRDANGDITGVVSVRQDVMESTGEEGELNRVAQEEDLWLLIDNANKPIFGIDKEGNVNEWNLKAAEIVGYSFDEAMGRDFVEEFISPAFRVQTKGALDNALQGRDTANFEFLLFTKSQEHVEVLLNVTTRRDASGDITGVVGVGQDVTDRKKAEGELSRVAQDLRLLIENASKPIIGIDTEGRVNEWNLKAAEIVGYKRDEVMGRGFIDELISPEFQVQVKGVMDHALQGRETADYEFPLLSKSGERINVQLNATTRRDVNGDITGVVGVGQDFTDRTKTERELSRVAQDLRLLIDTANAPIIGIDKEGMVNEWNLKAAEIVGYDSNEVMGRDLVEEFITPEYKVAVSKVLSNALHGQDTSSFEFPLFTKTGGRVDVLLNATPRRDANGDIKGVVGMGQDITDRKKAEAETALMAEEMHNLIDTANAPIFGIDKEGRVNKWNQRSAELVGYTTEEVMGKNFVQEFISPEYRSAVKAVLDDTLQGIVTSSFEFTLFSKLGISIELLLNANPRRNATGNIVGVIGFGQDVTEKRKAMKTEVDLNTVSQKYPKP
jgi:PAS domain S-box-containing protein